MYVACIYVLENKLVESNLITEYLTIFEPTWDILISVK